LSSLRRALPVMLRNVWDKRSVKFSNIACLKQNG
jgi:hypothetical protein